MCVYVCVCVCSEIMLNKKLKPTIKGLFMIGDGGGTLNRAVKKFLFKEMIPGQ